MTAFPWPRELVVKALRPWIIGNGGLPGGFIGLDVRPALEGEPPHDDGVHDHLVVVLRWQQDPCVYAIAVPLETDGADEDPSLPPGLSTGLPVASLEEFVGEVVLWLSEEFATGLVRRATRTRVGDLTFLTTHGRAPVVVPEGYSISALYTGPGGGEGRNLAEDGLDVTTARHILRSGRLLTWLFACVNNSWGEPSVGHAVVARPATPRTGPWTEPARLEVLQVVPRTPNTVAVALAFHAVRDAIDAGAESVVSTLAHPALKEIGFRRDPGGSRSVTWRGVQIPDLRRRGPTSQNAENSARP